MSLIDSLTRVLPRRIKSALVDLFTLIVVMMISSSVEEIIITQTVIKTNFVSIVAFSLFLNKDINGKSIGKFFTGFSVLSIKTGLPANPIQCALRNLFVLLWPIEVVFLWLSPERRLGDIVAGTRISNSTETANWSTSRYVQSIASLLGSIILTYYIFTLIDSTGIMRLPE